MVRLKVHLKFKNNNEDQVLMDSTDFTMKADNENMNNGLELMIFMMVFTPTNKEYGFRLYY